DEAEQERISAHDDLVNGLTDGYYTLQEAKAAADSAQSYLAKAEKDYSRALTENRRGELSFTDLYDKKVALLEQQKSIYEMQADYAKSLSAYNLQSAGYISDKLSGSGSSGLKNYEDGITTGVAGNSNEPSWAVNITANYKASFSVSIPEEYDVTHYELYTAEGTLIGSRNEISKSMTKISAVYSDTSLLTLKFFKDDELKYTAVFDGMQYSGTLDMQPAANSITDFIAGKWNITKKGMKSTFSVTSDEFKFDSFELYFGSTLIGKGSASTGLTHLSSTFGNTDGFTVKLLDSDKEVATLNVTKTQDGQQLLTY
ncbi:MAG: TolC family protein, partial [Oscillospiraceae bacterium]